MTRLRRLFCQAAHFHWRPQNKPRNKTNTMLAWKAKNVGKSVIYFLSLKEISVQLTPRVSEAASVKGGNSCIGARECFRRSESALTCTKVEGMTSRRAHKVPVPHTWTIRNGVYVVEEMYKNINLSGVILRSPLRVLLRPACPRTIHSV